MQGTIAQIVALTTHGNAFLGGSPPFDIANFYPGNSTFMFCESVRFVDVTIQGGARSETGYAADPADWFSRLRRDGVQAVRLHHKAGNGQELDDKSVSDRMLVGFVGGGGRWLIEALAPGGSDYWEGRWEVGDRAREDRRIWRVRYGRIGSGKPSGTRQDDLARLKTRLIGNLTAIGDFARRQKLEGFARVFDAGLAQLTLSGATEKMYHRDLAPEGALSPASNQLLAAAQVAWVFGGMGSWNDMSFVGDDQTIYDLLSEELYELLNAAIVAAANAGIPDRSGRAASGG